MQRRSTAQHAPLKERKTCANFIHRNPNVSALAHDQRSSVGDVFVVVSVCVCGRNPCSAFQRRRLMIHSLIVGLKRRVSCSSLCVVGTLRNNPPHTDKWNSTCPPSDDERASTCCPSPGPAGVGSPGGSWRRRRALLVTSFRTLHASALQKRAGAGADEAKVEASRSSSSSYSSSSAPEALAEADSATGKSPASSI